MEEKVCKVIFDILLLCLSGCITFNLRNFGRLTSFYFETTLPFLCLYKLRLYVSYVEHSIVSYIFCCSPWYFYLHYFRLVNNFMFWMANPVLQKSCKSFWLSTFNICYSFLIYFNITGYTTNISISLNMFVSSLNNIIDVNSIVQQLGFTKIQLWYKEKQLSTNTFSSLTVFFQFTQL